MAPPAGSALRALSALLFLVSAVQVTDNQGMPLLLAHLREQVWKGEDTTMLLVAYGLGAALGPLIVTWLLPLAAPKRLVLGALAVLAGADLALGFLPAFAAALGLRALAGAASGVLSFAQLGVAVHAGHGAVTAMTAGFLCALVAGAPAGALAVDAAGVPAWFWALAAAGLMLMIAAATIVPRIARPTAANTRSFAGILRSRPYRDGIIASVLIGAAVAGPTALFPSVLQSPSEGAGLGLRGVGLLYFTAGLGPLLALSLGPLVFRRLTGRGATVFGALLLAIPLACLPAAAVDPWAAGVVLVVAILVETLRRSAMNGHLAGLASDEDRSRYLGLRGVMVQVAVAGGTAACEALRGALGFAAACGTAAFLAVLSAAFVPARTSPVPSTVEDLPAQS